VRTSRRVLSALLAAGSLAALVTLPLGDQQQLSVNAWVIAVVGLLTLSVVVNLFRSVPLGPVRPGAIVRRRESDQPEPPRLPRNLLALEGMLVSARDNDRAFALRLQPRLIDLAAHYLSTDYGIDGGQPERATEILAGTAWMIDPSSSGRTPDPSEVEQLVQRLVDRRTTPNGSDVQPDDRLEVQP